MSASVGRVTAETFSADVVESPVPVLVKFWAEWCPPCKALDPVIERIAATCGPGLRFVSLNADDHPELSARYGALGLPVLKVFADGEVVKTILGAKPEAALRHELAAFLD